ncbi:glyoxalase [Polymorphobacter glacialis]|uniref:Glyoxalase n=1 Tax=Sandarakinorhabdus glacialis TaxID=1614636 RepID=A0A916ZMS2_9SPHN|nr:VOC family protein [Polymorphobacter glacialis]GGE04927.1 glyoxalase [Polymorphobacter glacialis]
MGVTGFGGLFFRARDPDALNLWYRTYLNIGAGCSTGDGPANEWYWQAQGGPTVFAPFKADTAYFAADKGFMINLRVTAIDSLIADLAAAGIAAETRLDWDSPETGRFARIHDPEGNAIEL